jgi:hypothetical protein
MGKSDRLSPTLKSLILSLHFDLDLHLDLHLDLGTKPKAKKNRENPVCISLVEEPCVLIMRIIEYDHLTNCLALLPKS